MHEPNRIVNNMNLTLELNNSVTQDILSLIKQLQRSRAPLGYRCDNFDHENTCEKVDLINGLADALIINLKIFSYDLIRNRMTKTIPKVKINREIKDLWRNWTFHSIICHEGLQAHSGQYMCGVQVNDTFFFISDTRVVMEDMHLSCRQGD